MRVAKSPWTKHGAALPRLYLTAAVAAGPYAAVRVPLDAALLGRMVDAVAAFDAARARCPMLRRVVAAAPAEVAWLLGPQRGAADVRGWLDERKPGAGWRLDAAVPEAEFDRQGPARVRLVAARGAVAIRGEDPLTGRSVQSSRINVSLLVDLARKEAVAC